MGALVESGSVCAALGDSRTMHPIRSESEYLASYLAFRHCRDCLAYMSLLVLIMGQRNAYILLGSLVVGAAFVALGLIMLFWPGTYFRWVHWSKVEAYAPRWMVRGWYGDRAPYPLRVRIGGIVFALFGIVAIVLIIYIFWFQ
jgi:hypothetical protein